MFCLGLLLVVLCLCCLFCVWAVLLCGGCVTLIDCLVYKGLLWMLVDGFYWFCLMCLCSACVGLLCGFVVCDYLWVDWCAAFRFWVYR